MNDEPQPDDFDVNKDGDETVAPEQRPLAKHLEGINSKSTGVEVKPVAESALADSWSRADVKEALEALGVGAGRIRQALPPPSRPRAPASEGLSPDYFREQADGQVFCFMAATRGGDFTPALVCSPVKALYRTSDIDGDGWALVVEVTDERGVNHDVALPYAEIATEPSAAVGRMAARGLRTHSKAEIALGAVRDAPNLPRAYFVTAAGRHDFGDAHVFVLPGGGRVIGEPPPGDFVRWRGNSQYCKTRAAGTVDGWKANVVAPIDGLPIPMAAIGTMLASPGIRHLPTNAEPNTTLHLVDESSLGKTTTLQIGGSVWGMGAKPEVVGSFLNSWKNTRNNMENLLSGTCDIGGCIDEIKTLDEKSGRVIAYDIALGQGKGRMYADGSARQTKTWTSFLLSTGELSPDELGDRNGRRQGAPDAGAEVRFINLPGREAFSDMLAQPGKTRADVEAFVAKLGAAASTDYGHAGPMFVEHLMAYPAIAEGWIHYYWGAWGEVVTAVLPPTASRQAARVASRLGSIACKAAHAAQVLELPWTLPNDRIGQAVAADTKDAKVASPARAMLWAFARVLEIWLGEYGGGGASTEVEGLKGELRNFFASRKHHFHVPQTLGDGPGPSPLWGWRHVVQGAGAGGNAHYLTHVDVLPATFTDHLALGWPKKKTGRLIRALNVEGLLIPGAGQLQTTHWDGEGNRRVYRILGPFFEE